MADDDIYLEVKSRLDESSARATTERAERQWEDAGDDAGRKFADGVNRGFDRIDSRSAIAQIDAYQRAVDRAIAVQDRLVDSSGRFRDDEVSMRGASNAAQGLTGTLTELGTTIASLGRVGGAAGTAYMVGALVQVASVAVQASQSLLLIPAAAGAAGAAFGTLQLATLGFTDALANLDDPGKFAESLRGLAPNAAAAAQAIRDMMEPLRALQMATQNALFAGVGPQLTELVNTYLPMVQTATTGIASAFNQMFMGLSNQLIAPETQAAIQTFLQNTTTAFQNLAPAVAPLTQAFSELMSVGSSFLPELATAATDAAREFSKFISDASRSGELKQWIQEGVDTLGQLGQIAWQVGRAFMALTVNDSAKSGLQELLNGVSWLADNMPTIVTVGNQILTVVRQLSIPQQFIRGIELATWHFRLLGDAADRAADIIAFITGAEYKAGTTIARPNSWTASPGPTGPSYAPGLGPVRNTVQSGADAFTGGPPGWGPRTYPGVPGPGVGGSSGGGGGGSSERPYIDPSLYTLGQNPIYGVAGPGSDSRVFDAQTRLLTAEGTVEDARRRVLELEADNTATAGEIADAKRDVEIAERNYVKAQQDLAEAQMGITTQLTSTTQSLASGLGQLGAALDADLGISKGLPGLADNLVRFLASLAAAPLLGQLSVIDQMNPNQGSGLVGMLASNGALGPQYTPAALQQRGMYTGATGYPGYGGGVYDALSIDQAIMSRVPAGSYDSGVKDLARGLADCSSSVEDLINIMDGNSTVGGELTTYNADQILPQRGFLPGMGGPGDFRIGFTNNGVPHMQATLPGGTHFNWGSDSAAAQNGMTGQGAYDPSLTEHYYRPLGAGPGTLPPDSGQPALDGFGGHGRGRRGSPGPGNAPMSTGVPFPANAGGQGPGVGGMPMDALMASTAALDMMAPGAGAAAKIGIQLANRTIQYAGQAASIGVSGLMETFLPAGSERAMSGWLPKILAGAAGARPALPNLAGGKAPQPQAGQGGGGQTGNVDQSDRSTNITVNNQRATEDGTGRDIQNHLTSMHSRPGP